MFGEVRLTDLLTIDKTCIRYMSLTSISLVLVSTVGMCLNTFKWIQKQDVNGDPVDNPYLAMIEAVCISYFSIEFLLRLKEEESL